jgi:hypothetical protein
VLVFFVYGWSWLSLEWLVSIVRSDTLSSHFVKRVWSIAVALKVCDQCSVNVLVMLSASV